MNIHKTLRLTAVTAVAALALAACGDSSSSGGATDTTGTTPTTSAPTSADTTATSAAPASLSMKDISVQLSWIKNSEFAGEFEADSKGYYKAAGFDKVDLVAGP